ncbi:serine/threonine-protein kinase 31-like isoform X2 [Mercenaria mercenaria]|uniref:serine/threonine-protein kinase 31-like isoform X2 n=1 Tax=Mercenaria mercenaria TaxID=6596 RepID=UPI00234E44FF|nr:serine/threonine-protein kinase 31-like isoform X2 [Mercenaria mercenaria]
MARKGLQTFDVFIGNLPNDANERNIGKMFSPYGEISGIIVKETTKVSPPYNKFAFVKFLCEPDADKAVKELDKTNVQGSSIAVKRADDRNVQKKKTFGEGGGRRGIRPSDTDSVESGSSRGGPSFASIGAAIEQDTQSQRETVLITYVETPITLWIQTVNDENTKKIFSITEQLAALCPAAQPVTGQPDPGKVYACCFTEDSLWYRCQVKQNLGTDKYKIQYIDYGNTEEVAISSLVELAPNVANVKGLACKIQLHNTRAKDLSDKQGIQFLKSLTDNQMGQLVRTRTLADGSGSYGQIFVENVSLSESMIQAGYCQSRPAMGKSNQQPRQQLNDVSMLSEVPGPQMMGQSFSAGMKAQRDRNTVSPLGQPPPLMGPPAMAQQHMPNMGFPIHIGQQHDQKEKKLQIQLSKKNQEIERIRNEKDAAYMQVEYMRSKVKTLQEEYAASAAKLQEDTLSKRINTLVALAGVVRHLREQFPTSKISCLLEEAMALCLDKDRVDNSKCRSLADVSTSLARYKAAQDEISKCKEQSELQDLIGTRDECRQDLHKSLSACLEEMEQLPLDTRSKLVQETQMKLVSTYTEFLKLDVQDVPALENVAPGFTTWKTKKDLEFGDVRTATDYCEGALQTALNQVKQNISVETISKTEKSDVDIDDLFKTYAHALQREINVTDLVHGKDANFVAVVIASVRKELHQEAATLENISVLHREFSTRKLTIEPWLNKPPAFTDFQENRKQLRSLKSKLRHIQADKLDLEESGDEEELINIKEEEEKIRSQLQAALVQSDQLLNEVATLADSNFPELILQYPDLGIDSYLLYKGIVKANREIDHYCLKPSFRPGLHTSVFSGEPVMLQEFHIGDSEHCSKEDFMKQLVSYNQDTHLIQAVFFSKSDRLAYVQSRWEGGQLIEAALNSQTLSAEQLHEVSVRLAEEVVEVHARGCIHGEITPQTVILREDNSVLLMYPDFSKLPNDRISKRYVTEGGLVFQTPELQYTSPDILGNAADVYNLVLFIFWLYCPNHKPTSLPNGSPNVKHLNPTMQQLFDAVLSGKTATRIHSQQVLKLLQEAKPTQEVPPQPAPVSAPVPAAQVPVIKRTDEPMEIGVFRAEDYITEPNILPVEPEPKYNVSAGADTDNSWTTESSLSGTNSSRGDSPLDNTVLELAKSDMPESVSKQDDKSSDIQEIAENLPVNFNNEDKTVQATDTTAAIHTDSSACETALNTEQTSNNGGVIVEEEGSDLTGVTGNTEKESELTGVSGIAEKGSEHSEVSGITEKGSELTGVSGITEKGSEHSVVSGITEKGAACETLPDDTLKTLLDESRTFLTSPDPKQAKSPLTSLLNLVRKSTAVE